MTEEQLEQIKQFSISLYEKVDQFHNAKHAELTTKYAMILAKDFPETDLKILEAVCWLHDIGRINEDEEHAKESAKLAEPFLKEIGISSEEIQAILHAVIVHKPSEIQHAKTIEAKLLYDADKIQLASVFGFIRMTCFLVFEKKIPYPEAVEQRWKRIKEVMYPSIQTEKAKKMLAPEIEKIEMLVQDFNNGSHGLL